MLAARTTRFANITENRTLGLQYELVLHPAIARANTRIAATVAGGTLSQPVSVRRRLDHYNDRICR
jgi:hypothetical protein